jgi:hypothetical protein
MEHTLPGLLFEVVTFVRPGDEESIISKNDH